MIHLRSSWQSRIKWVRIHDSEETDDDDNFQFLLRSMASDITAIQLIVSYSLCASNLMEAVEVFMWRMTYEQRVTSKIFLTSLYAGLISSPSNENISNFNTNWVVQSYGRIVSLTYRLSSSGLWVRTQDIYILYCT